DGVSRRQRSVMTARSRVGASLGGITVGGLSDRIGRQRAIAIALGGDLLCIPLWLYSPLITLLALGAFAIQFMVQGAWGVIPAHLNELSPDSVRGVLPGFAYQCGVMIASPITYIDAVLAQQASYATAMLIAVVTVFS